MVKELRTTTIVVMASLIILFSSLGSEEKLMAQPQPGPGGRDKTSSSVTALENRRAICLTPRFVENQVIVGFEESALLPQPIVGPENGGVGLGGGTRGTDCGTVVPCDDSGIPGLGTENPYLSQNLSYNNRKEYVLFLQARRSFLTREGNRLQAKYGVTVLSTNTILGTQLLKLPPEMGINNALQALKNDPRIKSAGKNWLGCLDSHDEFPDQTTPPNEDVWLNGNLWGMVRIGMKEAWQLTAQQGHQEIIVAVIDTGIELSHPDLEKNKWVNPGEIPSDGVDNDGFGPIDDIHGADWCNMQPNQQPSGTITIDHDHATNVAGVIGARGNNKGPGLPDPDGGYVAGTTWVVKLMSLKAICNPDEVNQHLVTLATTYAVSMGAHVINNSFGISLPSPEFEWDAAIKLANCQGPAPVPPDCHPALIVASAGNEGVNIGSDGSTFLTTKWPAAFSTLEHVIAVTGTAPEIRDQKDHLVVGTEMDTLVWDANWGNSFVNIAAPGQYICTTSKNHPDGGFCPDGTSFAAPFVTGCAALLQAKMRELSLPLLDGARLKQIITESADQVPQLGQCGGNKDKECVRQRRLLNCHRAMEKLICSETCGCSGNCADSTAPNPPLNLKVTP